MTGRVKIGAELKYGDIDTGGGKVWLRTTEDQTFVVIDPDSLAIRARVRATSSQMPARRITSGTGNRSTAPMSDASTTIHPRSGGRTARTS